MQCFECKSDQTQKIDAVADQLTKQIAMGTLGVGIVSGNLAAGLSKTSGSLGPKLLNKIKSRKPMESAWQRTSIVSFLIAAFFLFALFNDFNGFFEVGFFPFALAISILTFIGSTYYIVKKLPAAKDRYNRTWYCFKCGTFFSKKIDGANELDKNNPDKDGLLTSFTKKMSQINEKEDKKQQMKVKFKNPSNDHIEYVSNQSWLYVLAFAPFYFLIKGIWVHAFLSLVLFFITIGFSNIIYSYLAKSIIIKSYLKKGWIQNDDNINE